MSINGPPTISSNSELPVFYPKGTTKADFPPRRSVLKRIQQQKSKLKSEREKDVVEETIEKPESPSTSTSGLKSWADLVRGNEVTTKEVHQENASKKPQHDIAPSTASTSSTASTASTSASASTTTSTTTSALETNGHARPTESVPQARLRRPLAHVLRELQLDYRPHELFARGLINTGNICFMNSIIQALLHISPFYNLLDTIAKETTKSLKSDTPILDGLIELVQEIERVEVQDGKKVQSPVSPEAFYSIITRHPKFAHLERGRQEDAEEFLGYLLEAIHEEFANAGTMMSVESSESWTEIGRASKPISARHSGMNVDTPISRLFGGKFRSALDVPGRQSSVTYDPFQHVQLDIDDPKVSSIEDAFKLMSRPEEIMLSQTAREVRCSKTVEFDSLPPVLIVHLKRFTFETHAGSQKNSKPIAFSRQVEIPQECIAATHRTSEPVRYRLLAVVYHHGASAASGHYTVDVKSAYRVGESDKWVHVDDIMLNSVDGAASPSSRSVGSSKTAYLLFYVQC